jgi:CTP synthase (UTP-ammonia lyase)
MSFFFLFSFFFHFKDVEIALVGKYTKLEDAYASVIKALNHASLALNHRLRQENISKGVVFNERQESWFKFRISYPGYQIPTLGIGAIFCFAFILFVN